MPKGRHTRKHIQDIFRDVHEDGNFRPAYIPRFTNVDDFVNAKVKMLREQFCINVTDADVEYLRGFNTENEINAAVKVIINKYWE